MRPDPLLGRLVAGKYRLDRLIGTGGMGRVYEAENTWTGLRVAIKLLHPEFATDDAYCERFKREARSAARIAHPNTVAVLDLGEDSDGSLFMVQELLVGRPLSELLEADGPLDVARVLSLFVPIADALAAAHEVGVVHRDVKPANVMIWIDRRGAEVPKVVDFGLAKLTALSTMTPSGVVLGSPAYLAPEQIAKGISTAQGDQWALGVCLYQALSGRVPFDGESLAVVAAQILMAEVPPLPDEVPGWLAAIVQRALCREPEDRFANLGELRDALASANPFGADEPTIREASGFEADDPTMVDREVGARMKQWQEERREVAVTTPRGGNHRARLAVGHVAGVTGIDPRVLGHAIAKSLPFDPRLLRFLTYGDLIDALRAGEIDVAIAPPMVYRVVCHLEGVRLLGVPRRTGRSMAAALIAREGADLRGAGGVSGVWVDSLSASGFVVPRRLAERWAGGPLRYAEEKFLGSHEAVVAAILHGAGEIGGCGCVIDGDGQLLDAPFKDVSGVSMLARSGPLPEAVICSSPALPELNAHALRSWLGGRATVHALLADLGFDRIDTELDVGFAALDRELA